MNSKEWGKLAKTYHEELISPFGKTLNNPLLKEIKNIKNKKEKDVIDIGCGIGNLIPHLKQFKKITAIDFSEEMLLMAKNKFPKIEFFEADNRNLKQFYKRYNIAFAINSIMHPNIKDIDRSLSEARKVLKKSGIFIAVFPAIESLLYQAMIVHEKSLELNKNKSRTKKIIGNHDFMLGIINDQGKQKHFYKFEILYRLKKTGFKNIKIEKIEYPWSECGELAPKNIKEMPKLWDWCIIAKN